MSKVRTGLTVTAADGARLVADLVLPDRLPAPAVVIRTPYGASGCLPEALSLAEAGFACLVQDLRGRHLSEGAFTPGADERADGHASVDWTAAQPWCDGEVFLYGLAYEAYAAWCAAGHPAVRGIVSRQPWPPIGSPALDEELWWLTDLGTGRMVRTGLYDAALARAPHLTALIPAAAVTEAWPVDVGRWPATPSTYKSAARRMARAARTATVPSLHLGSWYCRSAPTTLRQAMLAPRADAVVGGWASALTHRLQPECALPEPAGPHPFALALEWLGGSRRGGCLLLGSGRWTDTDPIPPSRPGWSALPLGAGGVRLRHDPADPYPSAPHSADLAPLTGRDDVVRLTLDGPSCWHGTPRLTAAVTTDTGTELVATLIHEQPDGTATRMTDGTAPLATGTSRCEIRLAPVAAELPPGHRLHLELTAGRTPRYPAPQRRAELSFRDVTLHLPRPRKDVFT
ncbi:CocE/NonD family hydrolase [Streptosporangium sp. H16]|uniref:CocE/NonD family hydrolase n=1 Tax=Streptosporangium sp. H16 TaxID=3444184 RepID=UPI003F79266A